MTFVGWIQIVAFCLILVALTPVLGAYMTLVFHGERTWLSPVLLPIERAVRSRMIRCERAAQADVTDGENGADVRA